MPEFYADAEGTIEFEVYCGTCGGGLCGESSTKESSRYNSLPAVHVNACPKCLEEAKDEGHDEGYEERKNEESD